MDYFRRWVGTEEGQDVGLSSLLNRENRVLFVQSQRFRMFQVMMDVTVVVMAGRKMQRKEVGRRSKDNIAESHLGSTGINRYLGAPT